MRRKTVAFVALAFGLSLIAALGGVASADDVGITAVVDTTSVLGSRSISAVPVALTMNSASLGRVSGSLTVSVTEVAMPGPSVNNPWSVTAQLQGDLTSLTTTTPIASSNMTLSPTIALETNIDSAVVMSAGTAAQSLSHTGSAATLFSVAGEQTTTLYSGVYTGTGTLDLTIPSGTQLGSYTGTLTVTLVQ